MNVISTLSLLNPGTLNIKWSMYYTPKFYHKISNAHVDIMKFAIALCGLIILSKASCANGAIQFSQLSGGVNPKSI